MSVLDKPNFSANDLVKIYLVIKKTYNFLPQNCYGIDDGYPNDPITRF